MVHTALHVEAPIPPPGGNNMPLNGKIVAIIDDDEAVRNALRRLIQSAGWHARTFSTAEEFLSEADQPPPSCLVLDLHLPGLSGLELYERLKADRRLVHVVFVTAYPDGQTRELAMRAGAVAFLEKPFEEHRLLNAIEQALR